MVMFPFPEFVNIVPATALPAAVPPTAARAAVTVNTSPATLAPLVPVALLVSSSPLLALLPLTRNVPLVLLIADLVIS